MLEGLIEILTNLRHNVKDFNQILLESLSDSAWCRRLKIVKSSICLEFF